MESTTVREQGSTWRVTMADALDNEQAQLECMAETAELASEKALRARTLQKASLREKSQFEVVLCEQLEAGFWSAPLGCSEMERAAHYEQLAAFKRKNDLL